MALGNIFACHPHHGNSHPVVTHEVVVGVDVGLYHLHSGQRGCSPDQRFCLVAKVTPGALQKLDRESVQGCLWADRSRMAWGRSNCPGEEGTVLPVHTKGTFKTLGVIG
jgi:hypothetical protein